MATKNDITGDRLVSKPVEDKENFDKNFRSIFGETPFEKKLREKLEREQNERENKGDIHR